MPLANPETARILQWLLGLPAGTWWHLDSLALVLALEPDDPLLATLPPLGQLRLRLLGHESAPRPLSH